MMSNEPTKISNKNKKNFQSRKTRTQWLCFLCPMRHLEGRLLCWNEELLTSSMSTDQAWLNTWLRQERPAWPKAVTDHRSMSVNVGRRWRPVRWNINVCTRASSTSGYLFYYLCGTNSVALRKRGWGGDWVLNGSESEKKKISPRSYFPHLGELHAAQLHYTCSEQSVWQRFTKQRNTLSLTGWPASRMRREGAADSERVWQHEIIGKDLCCGWRKTPLLPHSTYSNGIYPWHQVTFVTSLEIQCTLCCTYFVLHAAPLEPNHKHACTGKGPVFHLFSIGDWGRCLAQGHLTSSLQLPPRPHSLYHSQQNSSQ